MPLSKSTHTTTSDLTRHLVEAFGNSEQKRQALLRGANISSAQLTGRKAYIAPQSQQAFIRNLSKLLGPGWVFRYFRDLNLEIDDDLQNAFLFSPNLGDGLDMLTKFCHMREPYLYIEQFRSEGRRYFMFDFVAGSPTDNQAVLDLTCAIIYLLIVRIWQPSWRGLDVNLPYARPDYTQHIKNTFACPVTYDARRYSFVIDEDICALENPGADLALHNRSVLNLYKQTGSLAEADEFVQTIKIHLESVSNHRPNADEIAQALRVSKRTLNRRLLKAGTSFRVLLDKSLKTRARKLLSETRLSRGDIAERLGYNDQTSFSRALRRWKQQDG